MIFADLSPLANHLWQSTLCVAVAWLLTLGMRKNRAAVRYGVWMAASVKFLIPFSLLVSAGAQLEWRKVPIAAPPQLSAAIDDIAQPFAAQAPAPLPAVAAPALNPWPAILFAVWLGGIAIGIVFWVRCWWQVRSMRRAATPLEWNLPVKVMSSPTHREPGVLGIRKPCLLLPEGIADRLTPPQLEAILAHELRHVERRDNLTAAIHMLVETIFWFHPCVWWIRARLMEERERACDEEVLRMGSEPQVYAESILKVCEFYLASPAPSAGVTGGELKKRIEGIMANRSTRELNFGKRMLFASAAVVAIAGPIAIGLMNMPRGSAQLQTGGPKAAANMAVTEALFIEPPAGWRNPGAPSPSPVAQVSGGSSDRSAKREPSRFEVVSIKPCGNSTSERDSVKAEPTRIRLGCTTAEHLILLAYVVYAGDAPLPRGVSPADVLYDAGASIQSGPSWLGSQRFTIEATTNVPSTLGQMRGPLMQGVLKERFKLRLHEGSRPMAVYELVQDKGGAKLPPAKAGSCFEMDSTKTPQQASGGKAPPPVCGGIRASAAGGVDAFHITTSDLSRRLSNALDKPLVDKTGLTGTYDVHLEVDMNELPMARGLYRGQPQPADSGNLEVGDPSGSVIGAMRKLGLQVKSAKGTAKVIVIDHIELPSAN